MARVLCNYMKCIWTLPSGSYDSILFLQAISLERYYMRQQVKVRAKQNRSPLCVLCVASSLRFAWVRAGNWLSCNPSCIPCGVRGGVWAFAEPFVRSPVAASSTPLPLVEVRSACWGSQNLRASNLVATQSADPMDFARKKDCYLAI